jgi:acylphosphatase
MISKRLLISGRVQGVFYRGWTEEAARRLGLRGWVRNLRSGEVEVIVSGPEDAVDELIGMCWSGPRAASVEAIEVTDADNVDETDFVTKPTV